MPLEIDDAADRPAAKPTDEIEITPEMFQAGLYELACWQDPMTPVCEISSDALAGAYTATVRAKSRQSLRESPSGGASHVTSV